MISKHQHNLQSAKDFFNADILAGLLLVVSLVCYMLIIPESLWHVRTILRPVALDFLHIVPLKWVFFCKFHSNKWKYHILRILFSVVYWSRFGAPLIILGNRAVYVRSDMANRNKKCQSFFFFLSQWVFCSRYKRKICLGFSPGDKGENFNPLIAAISTY